jgi:RNA polymerase sigma factor (sigma-70 family)
MELTQQQMGRAPVGASDGELVARVLAGELDAFTALFERYRDAVVGLAHRMLGDAHEAEDAAQETFVRAYTQLATYQPARKFSTWLLSIASHLAIDRLRRRRFLALPLETVPLLEWMADPDVADPERAALEGVERDSLQRQLERLPAKYRCVLVLRYWYDFSYQEIAEALQMPPTLVKARLHRGREVLAQAITGSRR